MSLEKIILPCLILFLGVHDSHGQNGLETLLESVEKNNKSISTGTQYWISRDLGFKTGLSLPDPSAEFDLLAGSPAGAGTQTEFTIVQGFESTSVYKRRKELSALQIGKGQNYLAIERQEILLTAKLTYINLIFLNRKHTVLAGRNQKTERLLNNLQIKLDQGEGNILDVNKARLQLLDVQNELRLTEATKDKLLVLLKELNGGNLLTVNDTLYPPLPELAQDFELLEQKIEENDPTRLALMQEIVIAQKQEELTQSSNQPRYEAGYRYQGILGQQFHGLHVGMSVPIREKKLKVEQRQAETQYALLNLESHRTALYHEMSQFYTNYRNMVNALDEYQSLLLKSANAVLLDKALALGEITTIQYFLENIYAFEAQDKLLDLERATHVAGAELDKWRL